MIRLLKKYAILVIASIVAFRILTNTIMTLWPEFLTINLPNAGTKILGTILLGIGLKLVINLFFVFLLTKEMKKEKIISVPVLILTFFSSVTGVLFFFLILADNKLNYNNLNDERIY